MCPYVTAGIQNPRAQNGLVSPSLSHPQKLKPLHSHTAPAMSAAAKAKASGGGRRGGAKDPTDALRSDKKRRDMDDSDDAELDRCLASSAPPPPSPPLPPPPRGPRAMFGSNSKRGFPGCSPACRDFVLILRRIFVRLTDFLRMHFVIRDVLRWGSGEAVT